MDEWIRLDLCINGVYGLKLTRDQSQHISKIVEGAAGSSWIRCL
jgi:hypothetical protein